MIVIDRPLWRWRGTRWAHLTSDSDFAELHAFATRLGLRRATFQGDHYDVPEQRWTAAVALGATVVSSRDLVLRLQSAGLRRPRPGRPGHGTTALDVRSSVTDTDTDGARPVSDRDSGRRR